MKSVKVWDTWKKEVSLCQQKAPGGRAADFMNSLWVERVWLADGEQRKCRRQNAWWQRVHSPCGAWDEGYALSHPGQVDWVKSESGKSWLSVERWRFATDVPLCGTYVSRWLIFLAFLGLMVPKYLNFSFKTCKVLGKQRQFVERMCRKNLKNIGSSMLEGP